MSTMRTDFLKDFCIAHPNWIIAAATLLVFLPVFSLKFWLIDDHEIVSLLTILRTDGLAGFWHQWSQVGDFGSMPRFRPVYYLLRAFEILLWRDFTFLWSAARSLIAFVFAVSAFRLASKVFSPVVALLFSLTTLCVPWLSDTLFKLGPAEAYAVLFTALLIFSLLPKRGEVAWLAVAFCIFMLVGIKENFYVLIPLEMWAVFALMRERKIFSAVVAFAFVVLSLICVAILAYKLHLSSGIDVYNQSVGVGRLNGVLHNLFLSPKGGALSLASMLACLYLVLSNKTAESKKVSIVVVLGCSTILCFNLYFYAGIPSRLSRYAFPYWPILSGMLAFIFARIIVTNPIRKLLDDKPMVRYLGMTAMCIGLAGLMTYNALLGHRYAATTIRTETAISQILQRAKTVDEIVVRTAGSLDYEPVYSIASFLQFRNVSKPLFLSVGKVEGAVNYEAGLSRIVFQTLNGTELSGGEGYEPARNRSNNPQRCLEVVFQASASSVCSERVLVPY